MVLVVLVTRIMAMKLACAFVHGLGRNGTFSVRRSLPQYWGWTRVMVKQHCHYQSYMDANTLVNPWSSPRLHNVACATLLRHRNNGTRVVVFTHSMGNLIFASALKTGVCSLRRTDAWVVMGAPWRGLTEKNMARLSWICRHIGHATCDARTGLVGASLRSLATGTPGLTSLATVAAKQATAHLCGSSAIGVISRFTLPLLAFGVIVLQHPISGSDGMVLTHDCLAPASGVQVPVPTYVLPLNHADTAGRTLSLGLYRWYTAVLTHSDRHHRQQAGAAEHGNS